MTIERLGIVGLGNMGFPMARLLAATTESLYVFDKNANLTARTSAELDAVASAGLDDLGADCEAVITMLPNADIVRSVVLGTQSAPALAQHMSAGSVIIDMSSSAPGATRTLGSELESFSITLLDAPVSGGVRKAQDGTLSIMLGGDQPAALDRVEPVLRAMGTVYRTGALGSGHATKALNNYVSAAGLAAACEAAIIGKAFGLDPALMVDVINASTGRNNSTEKKLKPFILSGNFADAGFALDLMAKDVDAAEALANELGLKLPCVQYTAALWREARHSLSSGADHTEIFRYLDSFTNDGNSK